MSSPVTSHQSPVESPVKNESEQPSGSVEGTSDVANRRPSKISKIENSSFSDSYDALVLEEEDTLEVSSNKFWTLPVTDEEGVTSDVTSLFLSIIEEPSILNSLWDPNSLKKKVWEKVAAEMTRRGCPILTAKHEAEAGAKCNQKWKNLCRMHASYQKFLIEDEVGFKCFRPKPKFYDEMDRILSHRPPEYRSRKIGKSTLAEDFIENLLNPDVTSPPSVSTSHQNPAQHQSDSDYSDDDSECSPLQLKSSQRFSLFDIIEILKQVRREDRKERKKDKLIREEDRRIRQAEHSQLMARLDKGNELLGKLVDTFQEFLQHKNSS